MSKTYLLIAGAQHGAWCWEKVKRILEDRGNIVHAIDLPGQGDDNTARSGINMTTYQKYVTEYIQRNNLSELIIVGHSMAGVIMQLIAPTFEKQIHSLVFIAPCVISGVMSINDTMTQVSIDKYKLLAEKSGDNSFLVDYDFARLKYFNGLEEKEAEKYYSCLKPQPFDAFDERVDVSGFFETNVGRIYVNSLQDNTMNKEKEKRFKEIVNGEIIDIDASHDPMLSNPEKLAEILGSLN